jgi:hypothetical protein
MACWVMQYIIMSRKPPLSMVAIILSAGVVSQYQLSLPLLVVYLIKCSTSQTKTNPADNAIYDRGDI